MFSNFGPGEIIAIIFVLLLIFGAKRIPEIGRALGKGLKEFRKAKDELKNALKEDDKPEKKTGKKGKKK